ncbi:MAG: alanine racemase [Candidatus Heimdallarchaeota archaeon]|nr:alanine racemase [Candidatus Heimdallarchaeota archaeon]
MITNILSKPTFLVNKHRAINNIQRMITKARRSQVRFCPHFKTHQSADIGEWFRKFGVNSIAVSSVDMANYFAENGWTDITIAFPVNIHQISQMNELAKEIQLQLVVESIEVVECLSKKMETPVNLWIKIDTGYHRTGLLWNDLKSILKLAKHIKQKASLNLSGLLAHSGHTYKAHSKQEIREIYSETVHRLKNIQQTLQDQLATALEISIGDTPSCSLIDDFAGVDEIRPGNFVFYDVKQFQLGACSENDIAVALACPVVAKHPERNEVIIYGGGIHLSKDYLLNQDGSKCYGLVTLPEKEGWSSIIDNTFVSSLSQEHGVVRMETNLLNSVHLGDFLTILPVHSCLTANLMKNYLTVAGKKLNFNPYS